MEVSTIITSAGIIVSLILSVLNYVYSHRRKAQTDKELELLKAKIDIVVDKEKKLFDERSKAYPEICEANYRARVKCREILQSPKNETLLQELKSVYNDVYNILFKYALLMKNDNVFLLQHNFKNALNDFINCLSESNSEERNDIYSRIDVKQNEIDNLINSKLNSEALELRELSSLPKKV